MRKIQKNNGYLADQEEMTGEKKKKERIFFKKKPVWVVLLFGFFVFGFWPYAVYFFAQSSYNIYTYIDPTIFSVVDIKNDLGESADDLSQLEENKKGILLAKSLIHRIKNEMDSTFGLSTNDHWLCYPLRWLDNRGERQKGTIHATLKLVENFATEIARKGHVDNENKFLLEARTKCFNISPTSFIFPSAEGRYRDGIKLVNIYCEGLSNNNPDFKYDMRNDDKSKTLMYVVGSDILDLAKSRLNRPNEEVLLWNIDDDVYFAQGIALVVRDYVTALIQLYPEITKNGGEDNYAVALENLDKICNFDPILIVPGDANSMWADHRSKMARYFDNVIARFTDVANSFKY